MINAEEVGGWRPIFQCFETTTTRQFASASKSFATTSSQFWKIAICAMQITDAISKKNGQLPISSAYRKSSY
jgi:hypothetical protein